MKKDTGKIRQDRVLTAIVGSYPKPKYVFSKSGRKLLDSVGFAFYEQEKQLGKREFKKLLDKAASEAIEDQNRAGTDIITDGEERRGHYILDVVKNLGGFNFRKLKEVSVRGGVYKRRVPTVTGKITYKKSVILDEYLFTKKYAQKIAKVGLAGPTTVADCVADEYYKGNKEKLAWDYSEAIRKEVGALIKAGCKIIQFDDPVLLRFPDAAKKWGLKALENCFRGYEDKAVFIVHICRGYPNKPLEKKGISYKANKEYYRDILAWLSKSNIDAVSIEGAQSNLDLSILPAIGKKKIMLGVLDVGTNKVETVTELVKRGKDALRYISKEQLILAPDCGMLELSRSAAKKKLKNMALAAERLNK